MRVLCYATTSTQYVNVDRQTKATAKKSQTVSASKATKKKTTVNATNMDTDANAKMSAEDQQLVQQYQQRPDVARYDDYDRQLAPLSQ